MAAHSTAPAPIGWGIVSCHEGLLGPELTLEPTTFATLHDAQLDLAANPGGEEDDISVVAIYRHDAVPVIERASAEQAVLAELVRLIQGHADPDDLSTAAGRAAALLEQEETR